MSLALTASVRAQEGPAEAFPLLQVRLLDSPFKHAQDLDRAYLSTGRRETFFSVEYPIPDEARRDDGLLVTRFEAHPGSMADGIFDLRIVKDE